MNQELPAAPLPLRPPPPNAAPAATKPGAANSAVQEAQLVPAEVRQRRPRPHRQPHPPQAARRPLPVRRPPAAAPTSARLAVAQTSVARGACF